MSQYSIALIIGSLRRDSFNLKLAKAITRLAPSDFSFKHLPIGDLPLYNQDDDDNPADSVKQLKAELHSAQGVIFITPEYNRSIPGVLKNALDHASRPYGQSAWANKPAGILGVSVGAAGTAMAQQHLRNIVAYLDMPTLNQPEMYLQNREGFFDADGNIGESSKKHIQHWVDSYVFWVRHHTARVAQNPTKPPVKG